jgi:hypothetical protein
LLLVRVNPLADDLQDNRPLHRLFPWASVAASLQQRFSQRPLPVTFSAAARSTCQQRRVEDGTFLRASVFRSIKSADRLFTKLCEELP